MSDIEERDASDLGQFGALTTEQQALVNAFAEMVRKGQVPIPSGDPSNNQGNLPLEEGGGLNSTQVERDMEDGIESESLRVELQHLTDS
jgi:hypothetical protein